MAEVVDSIIAELEIRYDQYVRGFEAATAAVNAHRAAIEGLSAVDTGSEGVATKASTTRKRISADEAAAAKKASAEIKAAARERADAERSAAKLVADGAKVAEREKQQALRATAKEQDAAAKAATVRAAAERAAAASVVAATEREEAARVRLAAVVERGAGRSMIAPGRGGVIGATVPRETSGQRGIPAAALSGGAEQVAVEREINHLLIDQAGLQARLGVATGANRDVLRDQLREASLYNAARRAGLSEEEAALRVERELAGVEALRVRQAAEQTAIIEKQLRAQSNKTAGAISLLAPTLIGGITAHELSAINDEYIRFSNSLKVAGVSALDFGSVQDHLLKTSINTGQDIGALADTYRSISLASHDLGASQSDTLKVTDAIAKSLRITGASGTAARGAILQLGHAFETGKVTAREFNGLALNAYPILQAAAAGSDKFGGSVAKLRAALIAGELSSKEFFDDVLKGSHILDDRVNKAVLTTAQGFTALHNALVVYVGSADQAGGLSAALGQALGAMSRHLNELIPAIAAVATALTIGYIVRMGEAAKKTKGLGSAILAAFGGPVGLAITALTLAVGSFYTEIARHDAVITRVNESYDEMRQRLRDAGDQAGLAATQTKGVGTSAESAIPGVENLTGKVRGLANELFRQADAAKKSRIETAATAASEAMKQERAAANETPGARNRIADAAPNGLFNMRNWGSFFRSAVGSANNLFNNGKPDADANAAYIKAVRVSQQARRELAQAYQSANGGSDGGAAPVSPQTTKALSGLKTKLDGLEKLEGGATGKRLDNIKKQIERTRAKISDIEAGASPAAASAAESYGGSGRGRRGPSAETLAKRAESTRVRGVHREEEFTNALKQAQDRELQAQVDLTNDTTKRADLERQRVNAAAEEAAKAIRLKGPKDAKLNGGVAGDGTYGDPKDVTTLLAINARTAALNIDKINLEKRRQDADDAASLDRDARDAQRADLQARLQLADTTRDRRALALQLLDLEYQQRAADLNATLAPDSKATKAERTIAEAERGRLASDKRRDETGINRQNEDAGTGYKRNLGSFDRDFFDIEKIKGLQDFNAGLDDSVHKALKLHGIFGNIVGDLIDMAIKQALIKPLAGALFGGGGEGGGGIGALGGLFGGHHSLGGSSIGGDLFGLLSKGNGVGGSAGSGAGGFFGKLLSSAGSIFGHRAAGGDTVAGVPYLVGEHGPEMRVFGQSGKIYPNNSAVGSTAPRVTIVAPQHYDLSNVVMTEDLVKGLRADNRAYANKVAAHAAGAAVEAAPGRVSRMQTLGS